MKLRGVSADEMRLSPYPHIAIENAFDAHDSLVEHFPRETEFGAQIRMHGDLTYPDPNYLALVEREAIYRDLHDLVYSATFIETFLEIFDEPIDRALRAGELRLDPRKLPIRSEPFEMREELISLDNVSSSDAFLFPRLDIGIGRLDYGRVNGGGGIHVDNLTRLVSILLYVDDNPSMVGGEHRMYRLDGAKPIVEKVYAPKGNMLVASLQSNTALHDVNPITAIDGLRKAMYMAVSCSTELWVPHSDRQLQKLTKSRYRPPALVRGISQFKQFVRDRIGA